MHTNGWCRVSVTKTKIVNKKPQTFINGLNRFNDPKSVQLIYVCANTSAIVPPRTYSYYTPEVYSRKIWYYFCFKIWKKKPLLDVLSRVIIGSQYTVSRRVKSVRFVTRVINCFGCTLYIVRNSIKMSIKPWWFGFYLQSFLNVYRL